MEAGDTESRYDNYGQDTTDPIVQKSRWEDYLDVFFAPTDLFRRRGHDRLAPPLITLLLLAMAFYYILLPAQIIIFRAAMPAEQMAKMGDKMISIMQIVTGLATPIAYLVSISITAALMWGLARLVDAKPEFRDMMIVATYAGFIGLLAQIATSVAIMMHGEVGLDPIKHASFGALRFVDVKELPTALAALLARVDVFKIWQAVILMIGFQVVTGVTRAKAALVAFGTWLLFAVPGMLGGGMAERMGPPTTTTE